MQMVVKLKILEVPCPLLAVIFNRFLKAWGLYPITKTSLRAPLVDSNFNLNSTSYTIVKIKT